MPPRVTIALPAYRGERFLAEALRSALAQTYADREVVVAVDPSPDATLEVARSFEREGARVVANEDRLGIAGNWNRCLELSRGELVCVTHQDDRLAPRFLERTVAALDAAPGAAFVHTNSREIDDAGAVIGGHFARDHATSGDFVRGGAEYAVRIIAGGAHPIVCPSVVARRAAYEAAGRFDASYRFALDLDMWLRILAAGGDVAYVGEPLIDYRRHAEQATALERKLDRYVETVRAKRSGLERLCAAGRLSPAEAARCRAGLAAECLKLARKFARDAPAAAREHIRLAFALRRASLVSSAAVAAIVRLALGTRRA